VTLGGFNGVVIHDGSLLNGKQPIKNEPTLDAAKTEADTHKPYIVRTSIVQGGFVVPFYVVLLAFIGGAVSLARRIPEYQKRSEDDYKPTTKQPKLQSLEVREVVVFQVMQLISAPLIAVVAFYALSPSTMSSAIGLAFLSGFASELVLLQIRGVVEGLQPHVTARNNPVNEPDSSIESGRVPPDPTPEDDDGNRGAPTGEVESPSRANAPAMATTPVVATPSQGSS
jgi:hypothetical protein